jgi:hypothetical protein
MARNTLPTAALRRPRALWFAVLVAVFFAIAPTLSHSLAFAGKHSDNNFEICSAQKVVAATPVDDSSSTDSASEQDSGATQQHCPFCLHSPERLASVSNPLPCLLVATDSPQTVAAAPVYFFKKIFALWLEPRGPPTLG